MAENEVEKIQKTDAEWQRELTPEQYRVLRQKGTERPFTGEYDLTFEDGVYRCGACGNELFSSEAKFDSGCGWPAFSEPMPGAVEAHEDSSHGMKRVEIVCARCGSHLGHVFPDGPRPAGTRFCINSLSLKLEKK